MKALTIKICETPKWLAHRCRLEAELNEMSSCPFAGAVCPLGLVSCGSVTPKMWEDLFEGEADEDDAGD